MKKQTYSPDQVKTSTFNDVCFFTKLRLIAGKFPRVDKHRAITFPGRKNSYKS